MSEESSFSREERAALHSLAEMFSDKDARDDLRRLLDEGATLREIVMAYRTNHRVVRSLKAFAGLVILATSTVAALKGFNLWPK